MIFEPTDHRGTTGVDHTKIRLSLIAHVVLLAVILYSPVPLVGAIIGSGITLAMIGFLLVVYATVTTEWETIRSRSVNSEFDLVLYHIRMFRNEYANVSYLTLAILKHSVTVYAMFITGYYVLTFTYALVSIIMVVTGSTAVREMFKYIDHEVLDV